MYVNIKSYGWSKTTYNLAISNHEKITKNLKNANFYVIIERNSLTTVWRRKTYVSLLYDIMIYATVYRDSATVISISKIRQGILLQIRQR